MNGAAPWPIGEETVGHIGPYAAPARAVTRKAERRFSRIARHTRNPMACCCVGPHGRPNAGK